MHKSENHTDSAWWHLSLANVFCGSNHTFSFPKQRQGPFPDPSWQSTRHTGWIFLDSCLDLSLFWLKDRPCIFPEMVTVGTAFYASTLFLCSWHSIFQLGKYMHIETNFVSKPFWGCYLQPFIVLTYEFQPFKALTFFWLIWNSSINIWFILF